MQKEDFYNDFMEDEIDISLAEQLEKYLIHWKWFVVSVIICMLLAFAYLSYAIPSYEATSTILVKDEKKGGMLSELSVFSDLGIGSSLKSNVDNEIEILRSRTLVESTISKLNLNIGLFAKENFRNEDLYAEAPISISIVNKSKLFDDTDVVLKFKFLTSDTFSLENETAENDKKVLLTKKVFKYGEKIGTPIGTIIIKKTLFFAEKNENNSEFIRISIKPLDQLTDNFRKKLKVEPISKTSSVVNISISDPVAKKAENFLDTMIQIYNDDAAEDKNFISENTSKFIANRLALIAQELDDVEQNVESFKKSNKLTDIESEAKLFVENSNEYDKKGVETEIQLNVVTSLLDFMKKSSISDLLPSNMISDKSDASSLINSYNQLVLDRNRILKSATAENPTVIKLEEQIISLKSNVVASLVRMKSNLLIQSRDLKSQEGVLNGKIGRIPAQERQFKVIARQQKVKEELYLYLLQKREETAISLAATEPNARVIDVAKADQEPLSPKRKIVYLAGLLFGFLVPFGIIYTKDLLNTKIQDSNDLDGKTLIPFIGDVPNSDDVSELIKSNSRSSSAEALRIVRTNLGFMLNNVEEQVAKKIFVTSTFASEGKTFISSNLAASFALLGKKVLLIGMDIRSPRLNEYIDLPPDGLTNYLTSNNKEIEEYIIKHNKYENFYILPGGIIPPNPPELLTSKKVDELFEKLKDQYDYIIVDTAPVSLVTDTLLIAKNADTFVYVMRARFLEKSMISIANRFFKDKKLPNMCIVLNDTNPSQKYSYGYGESVKKKGWFKKLIS
ncbi:GumC family protein [Flavobacterium nitrogenifigens]|uniref:non-specific protein-tyrosine kinase n=2 Tax=Flavobacterium nitrogenifigens TaxID=1617283 RepID=A0A521DJM1_9FLAO|nr:polysaccharide biosynthesis tyrosine autokinase [Flavobacterium nitrogenifigens]KAF2330054.1 polysaccharide biosynthesis tyrosine autokinase [Flavobacterium nitrogenifigens]SMO71782.1 capsular exopolysaccharide family [Flavobacterium nitrogenifigens]